MTKKFSIVLIAVASLTISTLATSMVRADEASDAQRDCTSDALSICGQFVPDRGKITACMIKNKSKLSPACRRHFK